MPVYIRQLMTRGSAFQGFPLLLFSYGCVSAVLQLSYIAGKMLDKKKRRCYYWHKENSERGLLPRDRYGYGMPQYVCRDATDR